MVHGPASGREQEIETRPLRLLSGRGERLIASARLVLAAFSLVAVRLENPVGEPPWGSLLLALGLYLAYALVVWLAALRWWTLPPGLARVSHGIDLASFCLFSLLSQEASSPFFSWFVFALVAAAIRWGWRGTLWTAAAALAAHVGIGAWATLALRDPNFEIDRFVIRSIHLGVLGMLLGYLGSHHERLHRQLSRLARWPRRQPGETRALLDLLLPRAARLLAAGRIVLVWEEGEEPYVHVATWKRGELHWRRRPPTGPGPRVRAPCSGRAFFTREEGGGVVTSYRSGGRVHRLRGEVLEPGLLGEHPPASLLCAPLAVGCVDGLLVAWGKRTLCADDLQLATLAAHLVGVQLDQVVVGRTLRQAAADQARGRLARDVHDGVLQSLAGTALHLAALERTLGEIPPEPARLLADARRQLELDQQALGELVRGPRGPLPPGPIGPRLRELADRIESVWGPVVSLEIDPSFNAALPAGQSADVWLILQEALANAARHGGATRVEVGLGRDNGALRLRVADDGRGFSFVGRRDLAALAAAGAGPLTIRQRVAALGGSLEVESSTRGAALDIRIPVREEEA